MSAETARTQTRDSSRRQSLSAIIQTVFGIYPSFAIFSFSGQYAHHRCITPGELWKAGISFSQRKSSLFGLQLVS